MPININASTPSANWSRPASPAPTSSNSGWAPVDAGPPAARVSNLALDDGWHQVANSAKLELEPGQLLRRGSRGEDVKQLQRMLNQQTGANLEIDGKLGPQTEAAIRKLQQERHLKLDGIVGPETMGSLNGPTPAGEQKPAAEPTRPPQGPPQPSGPVSHPPQGASQQERYQHYANMLSQRGVQVDPDRTYVIGLRGLDPDGNQTADLHNGNSLRGRNQEGNRYNDSFVVLRPGGGVEVLRGATYPGQNSSTSSPDVTGDGRGDVGMIAPGTYQVVPNGNHGGAASFHVRSEDGSGRLQGWRDTNHDGNYSDSERAASEARGDTLSAVLFHPGNPNSPRSIGCQTLSPPEYDRFLSAVGGGRSSFSYTLIEA
ncbi:MAG: peptidoglycan-binding protein [Candidatus Eremiobacteraeota bacterium]|nr:peptidoglycan-binding protein [Candidatus Eremiobacteraeota bacterium]